MAVEIERKFLIMGEDWKTGTPTRLVQGYLNRDKARTVRIRIADEMAWVTIKGPSVGMTRLEFEYQIPTADAQKMLELCNDPIIEKNRWLFEHDGMTWEIDEFFGENAGLIVAEIELESETQTFTRPAWVGKEVTDDPRYFNSSLTRLPFAKWGLS